MAFTRAVRFNENEEKLLRLMAQWFEDPENAPPSQLYVVMKEIGVDQYGAEVLIKRLASYGACTNSYNFEIDPLVVDIVYELDQQRKAESEAHPPDVVEQLTRRFRGYTFVAILVVAFLTVTAIVTLLNQSAQLIDRIIDWTKRAQ